MPRYALAALPVVFLASAGAAGAADRDFDAVVRGIESRYQTKHMSIPLMGLVKAVVWVARPHGVKQLDLAVFEDLHVTDARGFGTVVEQAVGERWHPMVVVHSRRDRETCYIYSRLNGKDWNLLIATLEPGEATIVRVKIDQDELARMLAEPKLMARNLGSDNDK